MEEKFLIKAKIGRLNSTSISLFILAGILLFFDIMMATIFKSSLNSLMLIFAIILLLLGFLYMELNKKSELFISSFKITGKTSYGKILDLPIAQISSVGMWKFKRVTITTSSGIISFDGVKNQTEIFQCISDLLKKRQEDTTVNTAKSSEEPDILEQLKNLKELLDNGIITQEEFELKKKQILGL